MEEDEFFIVVIELRMDVGNETTDVESKRHSMELLRFSLFDRIWTRHENEYLQ